MECLLSNVAFPGIGTWLAGHRIQGGGQMVCAAVAFLVTNGFALWFINYWVQKGTHPVEVIATAVTTTGRWPTTETKAMCIGLASIALFISTLAWALLFSIVFRNKERARANAKVG